MQLQELLHPYRQKKYRKTKVDAIEVVFPLHTPLQRPLPSSRREDLNLLPAWHMHCKYVWVWEDPNLSCYFWTLKKSVLHGQQLDSSFCHSDRAFIMQDRHQEALRKSVMLGHTSQTSWDM